MMATSCLRPRLLKSRCGSQMRNGAQLLVQRCEVRGHSTAASELPSPNLGLVCAVITFATSRKAAESNTHRAASPQMYSQMLGRPPAPVPTGVTSLRDGCLLTHSTQRHARIGCHCRHSWSCATSMQEAEVQGWIRPLTPEPQQLDRWGCVPNTASLHKVRR